MKHVGDQSLDALENVLEKLRTIEGLREKKRGIFYLKSKPFLHFHEDSAGLFADLRVKDDWKRFALNNGRDRRVLVAAAMREVSKVRPA